MIQQAFGGVIYTWDGSQLIAEHPEHWVEVGFPIADALRDLDPESTTLTVGPGATIRIGDGANVYQYDVRNQVWVRVLPYAGKS